MENHMRRRDVVGPSLKKALKQSGHTDKVHNSPDCKNNEARLKSQAQSSEGKKQHGSITCEETHSTTDREERKVCNEGRVSTT